MTSSNNITRITYFSLLAFKEILVGNGGFLPVSGFYNAPELCDCDKFRCKLQVIRESSAESCSPQTASRTRAVRTRANSQRNALVRLSSRKLSGYGSKRPPGVRGQVRVRTRR